MNQPHAVLPLEEYDRLKESDKSLIEAVVQRNNAELIAVRLTNALLQMTSVNIMMQSPSDILRNCGLVIVTYTNGERKIETIE